VITIIVLPSVSSVLCFRLLGAKFSKDERKDNAKEEASVAYSGCNDEEIHKESGQAKELSNFDRKKSINKRFRSSCRKWAAQKGLVKV
jgi:hypothetical protein